MLKRGQPSLYKLKEGRVNEECSCEQEHLLDEWTRSIGKLIKWVTLASHLLSLLDTACRFVMLLPAEWHAFTSCSTDINERSLRWNSSCILHGVGRSCITGTQLLTRPTFGFTSYLSLCPPYLIWEHFPVPSLSGAYAFYDSFLLEYF